MYPAVIKAQKIGAAAKEFDWHGSINSEMLNGYRTTILDCYRDDEIVCVTWQDNLMVMAQYSIFGKLIELSCAKAVLDRITSWPDVIELLKWFPEMNRPTLVAKYRRLPFDLEADSDDSILKTLAGRHIWWYAELVGERYSYAKVRNEWVMEPRKKSQVYNLKHFDNGRTLFNFTTADTGMRSVFLDTILKVA